MGKTRPRIIRDPNILRGKPIIEGTRISVEFLLEELAGGRTIAQLVELYPPLSQEEISAALEYAAESVRIRAPA